MKSTTLLTTALLAITSLAFVTPVYAADIHEIRREANRLKAKSNELKGLFHAHYRYASNYEELKCAVLEFREIAEHIRDHAYHASCDIEGLREDVRIAERMFASVEHAAYRAERCVVSQHRGKAGITRHIRKILNQTDFCLDELCDLVTPVAYHRPSFDHGHRRLEQPPRDFGRNRGEWSGSRNRHRDFDRQSSQRTETIRFGNSGFAIRFQF